MFCFSVVWCWGSACCLFLVPLVMVQSGRLFLIVVYGVFEVRGILGPLTLPHCLKFDKIKYSDI